jgi:hypothetical protein
MDRRSFLKVTTSCAAACVAPMTVLTGPVAAAPVVEPVACHLTSLPLSVLLAKGVIECLAKGDEMLRDVTW